MFIMKTNPLLLFTASIIVMLLIGTACTKQEVISNPLPNGNSIQLVKGDSSINGLISGSVANQLSTAFIQQRGNAETRLVKIAVKDLINYMHQMQTNALTDSLGIHFGYYTAATTPHQYPEYNNKYTLYFAVYPAVPAASSGFKSLGAGDNGTYLNHGTLYP